MLIKFEIYLLFIEFKFYKDLNFMNYLNFELKSFFFLFFKELLDI